MSTMMDSLVSEIFESSLKATELEEAHIFA